MTDAAPKKKKDPRGKGEGGLSRVPADTNLPLKYWQATIELPPRDGNRRRKYLRSKDKRVVLANLHKAQQELRERGDLITESVTVDEWFTYWLREMTEEVRPTTWKGYRSVVVNHIIPSLGPKTRLDRLDAHHIRRVRKDLEAKGKSATYALNAHRVMSASFAMAMRERKLTHNPAKMVKAPRKAVTKLDVLDLEEVVRFLGYLAEQPNGAMWAFSLLTGARRGETIGMEVDRVGTMLDLSWQMQRLIWSHGCDPDCGRKRGTDCPQRVLKAPKDYEYRPLTGGLYLTRPKSAAGERVIPLVEPLRSILLRHISESEPNRFGLVFVRPDGMPHDPDQESRSWRALMQEFFGEGRSVRLHDLRHTAADLLYLGGVSEDLIIEILGHSTRAMSRGYKSKGNELRLTQAMQQVSALFAPPPRMLEEGAA